MAEIEEDKGPFPNFKNSVGTKEEGDPAWLFATQSSIDTFGRRLSGIWNRRLSGDGRSRLYKTHVHGIFKRLVFQSQKETAIPLVLSAFEGVGELREKEDSFEFIPYQQIIQNVHSFPESFYLESPLYWKLKSALESIKLDSHFSFRGVFERRPRLLLRYGRCPQKEAYRASFRRNP